MNQVGPIDQHARALINAGIDGELDSEKQAELRELLATSGEAREVDQSLRSITRLMEELPELDPPAHLQESIERQIRLPVQASPIERERSFLAAWLSAKWFRTGAALAAGVVLTVGVYEMGSGPISKEDASNLAGTVVKNQALPRGEVLDQVHISNDSLNGMIELRQKGDLYTLDLQLRSDTRTRVVVDLNGRGLNFSGFTQMRDRGDTVTVKEGFIHIDSHGEQHYELNLQRGRDTPGIQVAPLTVAFYTNDILVHEARLSVH